VQAHRRPDLKVLLNRRHITILLLSYLFESEHMPPPVKQTTTVSTKGQVILPKSIREQLHWNAGTRLVVENTNDGVLLKAAPFFAPTRPVDVFACLPRKTAPKTLKEMEGAIAREVRRRHARDRY
jgi:AbrB family looped-hinge helix DNA binding protein